MRTVVPQLRHRLLAIVASLLLVTGCFPFNFGNDGLIDPSDPDALMSALSIPGAQFFEGAPPGPGGYGSLPSLSGSNRLQARSGSQLLLSLSVSASGPLQFFIKVAGARGHFRVSKYLGSPGTVEIPVDLSDAVGSGAFGFESSVQDESGNVSYPANTVVDVTRPGGSQTPSGGVSCGAWISCPNKSYSMRTCVTNDQSSCWSEVGDRKFQCASCNDCDAASYSASDYCVN